MEYTLLARGCGVEVGVCDGDVRWRKSTRYIPKGWVRWLVTVGATLLVISAVTGLNQVV